MSLADFTTRDILKRIRYDPLTKKGSVLDVVQLVMGCKQKDASHLFRRIYEEFPEVHQGCTDFKFPGQGQRLTPVAPLKTLIEIAWLCPGHNAKVFRQTGAVVLCRALGGDLSLVDEIRERRGELTVDEQEALLAGTGVTIAQANRTALELAQVDKLRAEARALEIETECRRQEHALSIHRRLKELAADETNEVHKLYFEDAAHNYITGVFPGTHAALPAPDHHDHRPISISMVASDMGVRLRNGVDIQAGRIASLLYKQRHGTGPPKHKQESKGGRVIRVNTYTEADRDLLEQAIRQVVL